MPKQSLSREKINSSWWLNGKIIRKPEIKTSNVEELLPMLRKNQQSAQCLKLPISTICIPTGLFWSSLRLRTAVSRLLFFSLCAFKTDAILHYKVACAIKMHKMLGLLAISFYYTSNRKCIYIPFPWEIKIHSIRAAFLMWRAKQWKQQTNRTNCQQQQMQKKTQGQQNWASNIEVYGSVTWLKPKSLLGQNDLVVRTRFLHL